MPEKTFHNLPEERQREILDVAYKEFTVNDYRSASLSNIIKRLSLAKGSFYRYFSSKKELYFYLLEKSTGQRFEKVEERISDLKLDLYDLLLTNWRDKIEYETTHPIESGFFYRVLRERYNEELGNLEIRLKKEITEKVELLIMQRYPESVRKDIDPFLMAFSIVQFQFALYDYLAIRYKDDLVQNIRQGKSLFTLHEEEIIKLITAFTIIIKSGISNNQRP
jgi:AcrR family transcriptional regulator